jgi:transcriptional regulator with GAF, ATPase, and Fis domain
MDPRRIEEQLPQDIARREQGEEKLKERLKFEALLTDLSARFINLSPEEVDRGIEQALKAILDFFQVDRCGLVRTLPGRSTYQITHAAYGEDVPPVPERTEIPISLNPWAYEKMIVNREVVAFSRIDDLPAEAEKERRIFEARNMKSLLSIPLLSGEKTMGSCALVSTRSERTWPEALVRDPPEIDFFENSSLGGLEVIEAIRNPGTKTDDVPT